jgi:hypothetical protein
MSSLTLDDMGLIQRALSLYSGVVAGATKLSDTEVCDEMRAIRIAANHVARDQGDQEST